MTPRSHLPLTGYYALEFINSFACTVAMNGLYFWTVARHGYTDAQNLLLGAAAALMYALGSRPCGRLGDRLGHDRLLAVVYPALGLVLLLAFLPGWRWFPFVFAPFFMLLVSATWPALEAAIIHVPARISVPARLGIYNLTWGAGNVVAYGFTALVIARAADAILWGSGLFYLAAAAGLILALRRPAAPSIPIPENPHAGAGLPVAVKQRFVWLAWTANGLSYFTMNAFIALTPFLGRQLELSAAGTLWLACSLFLARTVAFMVFTRWTGWHYRIGWSLAALWLSPACLLAVFFLPWTLAVLAALVVWGFVAGLSYSASIYYSLDFGENKGELGGLHESIIGIGSFSGPLAGALGSSLLGSVGGAVLAVAGLTVLANLAGWEWIRRRCPPGRRAG